MKFIFCLTILSFILQAPTEAAVFCDRSKNSLSVLQELGDELKYQLIDGRVYASGNDNSLFNSIGKIKCGDIAGTAFFLGPCAIVTNHHFLRECKKDGKENEMQFEYKHNGSSFQKKMMPLTVAASGNSSEIKTKESINDPDWLVLKPPQCEDQTFPTLTLCPASGDKEEISGAQLVGLAYDRDDSKGLSLDRNCKIYLGTGNFKNFGHDCSARAKTSGAPLFKRIGQKNCLLAIHAGCYSNGEKCETGITKKFYEDTTFNFAIPAELLRSVLPGR